MSATFPEGTNGRMGEELYAEVGRSARGEQTTGDGETRRGSIVAMRKEKEGPRRPAKAWVEEFPNPNLGSQIITRPGRPDPRESCVFGLAGLVCTRGNVIVVDLLSIYGSVFV